MKSKSKEINYVFSQTQSQSQDVTKSTNQSNLHSISLSNSTSISDIEKEFYIDSINSLDIQIEKLKKFLLFKNKIISDLQNQSQGKNLQPKNKISITRSFGSMTEHEISSQRTAYEKKINETKQKFRQIENELKAEKNRIQKVQDEMSDFSMRKYQLKRRKEKMLAIKNELSEPHGPVLTELNEDDRYVPMLTTSGNMCKSRLGNKLLLSLDVGEINKTQNFKNAKLAYPVLKRKKIVFDLGNKENNTLTNHKSTAGFADNTKKKLTLDNYNQFNNGDELDFISKTVC